MLHTKRVGLCHILTDIADDSLLNGDEVNMKTTNNRSLDNTRQQMTKCGCITDCRGMTKSYLFGLLCTEVYCLSVTSVDFIIFLCVNKVICSYTDD